MLNLTGHFKNGAFIFNTKNHKDKQRDFAQNNDGKKFIISIETVDSAAHYQHKFYRGCLLPSIAECMGEKDENYVHTFIVKKQFLFYPIEDNNVSKVPKHHKKEILFLTDKIEVVDGKTGEITEREVIYGYLRSMATLTNEEFKKLLEDLEHWLIVDLGYRIIEERQQEAIELKKAMKIETLGEVVDNDHDKLFSF